DTDHRRRPKRVFREGIARGSQSRRSTSPNPMATGRGTPGTSPNCVGPAPQQAYRIACFRPRQLGGKVVAKIRARVKTRARAAVYEGRVWSIYRYRFGRVVTVGRCSLRSDCRLLLSHVPLDIRT